MKEILKSLGFTHITDTLWRHQVIGTVSFKEDSTPDEITHTIFYCGKRAKADEIKEVLYIKKE